MTTSQPAASAEAVQHTATDAAAPLRAWSPTGRTAVGVIATVGLAVLAACSSSRSGNPGVASVGSGSASASSSTSSASNGALAFSRCMRSRGISNFPDPDGTGSIPKKTPQQLGVSNAQYQATTSACAHLLPNSGRGGLSEAELLQAWNGTRSFARCMRSHGVSNWPDPTDDGEGTPIFYLQNKINPNAPQIVTQIHACQNLIPADDRSFGGSPGGVRMCPGDKPNPRTQHSACE